MGLREQSVLEAVTVISAQGAEPHSEEMVTFQKRLSQLKE